MNDFFKLGEYKIKSIKLQRSKKSRNPIESESRNPMESESNSTSYPDHESDIEQDHSKLELNNTNTSKQVLFTHLYCIYYYTNSILIL